MAKRKMAHAARMYVTRHDLKRIHQSLKVIRTVREKTFNRSIVSRLLTTEIWLECTAVDVESALVKEK